MDNFSKVMVKIRIFLIGGQSFTGGSRIVQFLEPGKNNTMQNSYLGLQNQFQQVQILLHSQF